MVTGMARPLVELEHQPLLVVSKRQRYASKWQAGWDSSRAIEQLFFLLALSFEHRIFSRELLHNLQRELDD
jgi:hypothetical protein